MNAEIDEEAPVDCQALTDACLLLFGEDTAVSPEFIHYLRMSGLKAAFRNLAMRNHPDMASQIGASAQELQARFLAVRRAYELLVPYVSGEKELPPWRMEIPETPVMPHVPPHPDFSRRTPRTSRTNAAPDAGRRSQTFYHGEVPQKELRFGEYLYYRGRISWENMFAALVWQRLNRPRLGEIALEKGLLSADDMLTVRRYRRHGELLGETAVRLGLLQKKQLSLLLGFQRLYNCQIGRYFVDHQLITPPQMEEMLREQSRHNLRCRMARGR